MLIHGDKLVPGQEYIMKVWKTQRDGSFIKRKVVRFVKYTENGKTFTKESFEMKDLHPSKNQEAHFEDMGEYPHPTIILKAALKIWVLDEHRITFSIIDTDEKPTL